MTAVTRPPSAHLRPAGNIRIAAAAIGGLSILLVLGLAALGVVSRMDSLVGRLVSRGGAEKFSHHLPVWCVWLVAVALAFGLAFAILSTAANWRRGILWLTAVFLVAAWAPVLSLASYAPAISAPWIATFWSGVCSLVYAANYRMPADESN